MILQLAFRNIFRHRGRFILSTFVITVASLMLVFATGQIAGVKQALVRGMTDSLTGHLQIKAKAAPREFFDASSGRRLHLIQPEQLRSVMEKVGKIEGIEALAPRLRFTALIGNGEKSTPALVMAIDPVREAKVTTDLAPILSKFNAAPQAALISHYLSKKSGVGAGQEILILTETPDEAFNGRPHDIVGYAESPVLIDEYLNAMFIVNIERARKMIYVEEVATEIAIRVKPAYTDKLEQLKVQINAQLTPQEREYLGVYTYAEVAQAIGNVGKIAAGMAVIQVGAVLFIMLIIVLIVTRMGLLERQAEIGTLMSLGMTRMRLLKLFMAEVFIKVVIGYSVGVMIALFILNGIRASGGIKASTLVEQYMNGGKIMLPVIDANNVLLGFVLVVVASLFTTMFSCWKAGGQDVIVLLSSKK